MANVFDLILGKKEKGLDIFIIPQKKYCNDRKKLSKMEKKDILVEVEDMEKYISSICHKLDQGKKQYEKSQNKLDQTTGKLNVLNQKMGMISNQHEELQVKFMNLQGSLEMMTKQKQTLYKTELQFIQSRELSIVKVPDLATIIKIYREQIMLMDKITYQNKQLKQKYSQLQTDFFNLSQKIAQPKPSNKKNNELDIFGQQTEPDDIKNNQFKLVLQTKEQMNVLLNKKISELEQKIVDLNEKMNDLYHEIQKKEAEIKQKDQYTQRLYQENSQNKQKITQLKEFQEQLIASQNRMKNQIRGKSLSVQKLSKQIMQLKQKLKLNEEQKKILIGNHNQKMVDNQFHEKQNQLLRTKFDHQIQAKNRQIADLKSNLQQMEKQKAKLQSTLLEYSTKQKQFLKTKDSLAEQTKKRTELQKKLQDEQENNQIKLKKLQFVANQQRIKAEALKRSLTNLQAKEQENRKQLDQIYQKKMVQDRKIAKMDMKIKSYKEMIQYLQKEKVEMERTFESKIKTMEEVVAHDTEEDESQHRSEPSDRDIIEKDQATISKLRSRIVDLEQEIYFLKEENKNLAEKRNELQCSNMQLEKNFKVINEKRQQIVKQFKKIVSMQTNPASQKPTKQQQKNSYFPGRDKKIAEKALKGFDIFSKHICAIYKQFLNLHIADIQKKQVKDLQGQINGLVGKCEDMKDVFQGYL